MPHSKNTPAMQSGGVSSDKSNSCAKIDVGLQTTRIKRKVGKLIETIENLIEPPAEEVSGYKEMEEFRNNFKELFDEVHVKKLIVLIDDLDRCLPKIAIETLEAVRMFLWHDEYYSYCKE